AVSRPRFEEFAAQVGVPEFVGHARIEDVGVGAQHALHAYVGDVGERIGGGGPVGAAGIGAGVVDVVARGDEVGGAKLMVEAADDDVAIEDIAAAADEVVGVGRGAGTVRQRKKLHCRERDGIESLRGDDVAGEGLSRGCGRAGGGVVNRN